MMKNNNISNQNRLSNQVLSKWVNSLDIGRKCDKISKVVMIIVIWIVLEFY